MPTLPNMGLITPTLGGDRGVWDDKVNACFALVDAHDHTAGKGLRIVTAALNINADLPVNGFSITTLGKIAFSAIALPVAGSLNLFVNTANNELYWRTAGGANVKLTSVNSINTSLVGGIVGDYTSVSAEVAFDDANDRYTFKQNNATGWAKMASGDVRIYEAGTNESVYVGLKAPAALAASYDITLPLVLPAATVALQISSTGVVTASNTFTDVKFSTPRTMIVPAGAAHIASPPAIAITFTTDLWQFGNGLDSIAYPIVCDVGTRITGFSVAANKSSDATDTLTARLEKIIAGAGSILSTATNLANAPGAIAIGNSGLTQDVAAGESYLVRVFNSDATPSGPDQVYELSVTYTRP